jgi:hypothetical protein
MIIKQAPKKPLCYVAGPLSGVKNVEGGFSIKERKENVFNAVAITAQLVDMGFVTHVPHAYSWIRDEMAGTPSDISDWDYVLGNDEQVLLRCDCLYRLAGASAGADREVVFALANGIYIMNTLVVAAQYVSLWNEKHYIQ